VKHDIIEKHKEEYVDQLFGKKSVRGKYIRRL
jgi:hypothetical protein